MHRWFPPIYWPASTTNYWNECDSEGAESLTATLPPTPASCTPGAPGIFSIPGSRGTATTPLSRLLLTGNQSERFCVSPLKNNFQMNMIWRRRLLFILACNYQICFSDLLHGHSCLCAEHVYRGMLGWYFYLRYPHMVYLCNSCVFNFVQMVVTTYILHISKCFF